MRDIRPDLKERLEAVETENGRLRQRLDELKNEDAMLRTMLAAENHRWHGDQRSLFTGDRISVSRLGESGSPIAQFLLDTLSDGADWPLDRLKEHSPDKGIFATDETSLGRALHGALIGLKRRGLVEMVGRGVWRIQKVDAPSEDRASLKWRGG